MSAKPHIILEKVRYSGASNKRNVPTSYKLLDISPIKSPQNELQPPKMLAKIIFIIAVIGAILSVILLALFSHPSHISPQNNHPLAISLYLQKTPRPSNPLHKQQTLHTNKAFIFHHKLSEGPHNTSKIIGKAQGLVLPIENFALAAFNIIYLTFDTPEYSGSIGIEERRARRGKREEFAVVGGTGFFAFARGVAVFVQRDNRQSDADAAYRIKLRLSLPGKF